MYIRNVSNDQTPLLLSSHSEIRHMKNNKNRYSLFDLVIDITITPIVISVLTGVIFVLLTQIFPGYDLFWPIVIIALSLVFIRFKWVK